MIKYKTYEGYCPVFNETKEIEVKLFTIPGCKGFKASDPRCDEYESCTERICPIFLEHFKAH